MSFILGLRRYFYNSNLLYSIRIFIALSGVVFVPWWYGESLFTIPLTLGVVAAALTDLDDRLTGRLRNLVITLACFFIASVSIELLFPYPWLFALGLLLSTASFILLGSLGQRYATIAFGALLIAIYTMLGVSMYDVWYVQPLLLLIGAIWYNLITLLGHLILPIRPLQDNLARCFEDLARYLDAKSMLFDPDEEHQFTDQLIHATMANGNLVNTLNQTKVSLLTRLKGDRGQRNTRRMLRYYFVAQDIHEQASSSHAQYQQLSKKLRYTDILFRFQRLMTLQSKACLSIAYSIRFHQKYVYDTYQTQALAHLEKSLSNLQANRDLPSSLIQSLHHLLKNLKGIDTQLSNIESEQTVNTPSPQDNTLADDKLTGIKDIWSRIAQNLTPQSELFRHAVRMSIVLFIGYAIIQLAHLQNGYWIMLTSLFVCQPNYNATRARLTLRVLGTIAGILLGLPILYFVPSQEGQLILIVISGVLFFAFRNVRYAYATMFITLLVLFCFNLLGEGFRVAIPRVIDTLIGCGIAWAAVSFIWPDWKFRHISLVLKKAIDANCRYLDAILEQYHQGKNNSVDYRIVRRNAHNRDAELASVISSMAAEPRKDTQQLDQGFRLLCLNHSLLGYISALGAHREKLTESPAILSLLDDAVCYICDALQVNSDDTQSTMLALEKINQQITEMNSASSKNPLVTQQLALIIGLLPEFITLSDKIYTDIKQ
ncbi:YccS family putative transporter [Pragia fontium]|uniref:TIGR01666 family membrane protein n=2 Tax=Pragia fontium TaxID=82985 RepID=A0AAJ4WC29_9GAMM|nr:YccS family putative transporter [Pragia fontium]AKJ42556.1 membrane protein [Pragia fontium]SFD11691.1 TIGR01666 family membrane protein [Pragia fontium DSM 5563 = ATCC 49100]SUB82881.1 Inner membrane protein yccS [Pragia fontium]VEJ55781.1 Inner membrane protein yccS [Pragia fontium]GKX62613.1 membrane protein [Pragia fontium]